MSFRIFLFWLKRFLFSYDMLLLLKKCKIFFIKVDTVWVFFFFLLVFTHFIKRL